jgi:hypothetical protein
VPEPISGAMMSWYQAKIFVEHAIFFSSDALHVTAGVIVWLILALVLRRPASSWRPWLGLLILVLLNEGVDLWVERWPIPAMQYGESAKDILLTMTLPAVLIATVRLRPQLFTRPNP